MKLNIGSGKDYKDGWVNLDINTRFKADIYRDIMNFDPFEFDLDGFDEVYAKDVLDHITFNDLKKLLRRIYSWINHQGTLIIHLPNFDYCARKALNGESDAMRWIYGSDGTEADYASNIIRWGYTPKTLRNLLTSAGFTVVNERETCEGYGFLMIAIKREIND